MAMQEQRVRAGAVVIGNDDDLGSAAGRDRTLKGMIVQGGSAGIVVSLPLHAEQDGLLTLREFRRSGG